MRARVVEPRFGAQLVAAVMLAIAPGALGSWRTATFDSFESGWAWSSDDLNPDGGHDFWGRTTGVAHTGVCSAHCTFFRDRQPVGTPGYEHGMTSFMRRAFDFTAFTNVRLSFWCYEDLDPSETILLRINDADVWTQPGNHSAVWTEHSIELPAYAGLPHVTIEFWLLSDYVMANGDGVYIDDVHIEFVGPPPAIRAKPAIVSFGCVETRADRSLKPTGPTGGGVGRPAIPVGCSTTGPMPPPGVAPKLPAPPDRSAVLLPVPGYYWRHGCGPTALAMVLAYHDMHGYDDLFPDSAALQLLGINQRIASEGTAQDPRHYEDYGMPLDFPPGPLEPDRSMPPLGDEHPDDSIADFMRTSWKSAGSYYGWSWAADMGLAFESYVDSRNPAYMPTHMSYSMQFNALTWSLVTGEIDSGWPMVFLVDTDADGETDHFVAIVGYRETPLQQYACLDTWSPAEVVRWCDFERIGIGQPWGVSAGWTLHLAPYDRTPCVEIYNDGPSMLEITGVDSPTWVSISPPVPPTLPVPPGCAQLLCIEFDCELCEGVDLDGSITVHSTDPNTPALPVDFHVNCPEFHCDIDTLYPNGGEQLCRGDDVQILWASEDTSGSVRIDLLKATLPVANLTENTPDDGSFPWTVQSPVADGTDYQITITDVDDGMCLGASVAFFTIASPPSVQIDPVSQAKCEGESAQFSLFASSVLDLQFQWRRNGDDLLDNGRVVGTQSADMRIDPLEPNDAGQYDAVVTNPCGVATSSTATLTVSERIWGDGDCDGGIGFADFLVFEDCIHGPEKPPMPASGVCRSAFDGDGDGDVDGHDAAALQLLLSPGLPECLVNEDCDDGLFCTGIETCEDGHCVPGTWPCTDPGLPLCSEFADMCIADCTPGWETDPGDPGASDAVLTLTIFDDGGGPGLYAGGMFISVGGRTVNRIAAWDGQSWSHLGGGTNGTVRALTVFDDGTGAALYAGGDFSRAGGQTVNKLGKWNGSNWSAVGGGVSGGNVYALAVCDDGAGEALYVGGDFVSAGSQVVNGIAKWRPDTQTWEPLDTGVVGQVRTIAVYDDGNGPALYVGGAITQAGGVTVQGIARWHADSWSDVAGGVGNGGDGSPSSVYVADLHVFDDGSGPGLFVVGSFDEAGETPVTSIARWNASGWSAVGNGLAGTSSTPVVSGLAAFDDWQGGSTIYITGEFQAGGAILRAAWLDAGAGTWMPMGTGLDDTGHAVASGVVDQRPAVFVGGEFRYAGGQRAYRVVEWSCGPRGTAE